MTPPYVFNCRVDCGNATADFKLTYNIPVPIAEVKALAFAQAARILLPEVGQSITLISLELA